MKETRRIMAYVIMGLLATALVLASWRYINAVLGAIILLAILKPFFNKLVKEKKYKKTTAAWIMILASLIVIIIPVTILTGLLIDQISGFQAFANGAAQAAEKIPFLNEAALGEASFNIAEKSASFVQSVVFSTIGGVTNTIVNLFLTFTLLYYLLINGEKAWNACINFLPYSKRGHKKIMNEFKRVVQASVVSTSVVAILQGLLIGIGFAIFGLPSAVLWGFIGAIASFLPVVGTALVWIPGIIYLLTLQLYPQAIGLVIWGLFLANIDNIVRPLVNKKVGDIHPLLSLWGIFIGIPLFGFLGIFIGPLLISVTLLLYKLHHEEFDTKR